MSSYQHDICKISTTAVEKRRLALHEAEPTRDDSVLRLVPTRHGAILASVRVGCMYLYSLYQYVS